MKKQAAKENKTMTIQTKLKKNIIFKLKQGPQILKSAYQSDFCTIQMDYRNRSK